MNRQKLKKSAWIKRHHRVRKKVFGTEERPRLSAYRSLKNIYTQLIDDVSGKTLIATSTRDTKIKDKVKYGGNIKAATLLGEILAEKAKAKGITKVVFDRGGYSYHGRIKALAEGASSNGLSSGSSVLQSDKKSKPAQSASEVKPQATDKKDKKKEK